MIYSQTPLHNGPVRVSIKTDGDCAMLILLDTQWSSVLHVPPSYLPSLHLFISQPLPFKHSHRDAQMQVLATPPLPLPPPPPPTPFFLKHYSLIKDSRQIFCQLVELWILKAEQTHNIITQEAELCRSSRLPSTDLA